MNTAFKCHHLLILGALATLPTLLAAAPGAPKAPKEGQPKRIEAPGKSVIFDIRIERSTTQEPADRTQYRNLKDKGAKPEPVKIDFQMALRGTLKDGVFTPESYDLKCKVNRNKVHMGAPGLSLEREAEKVPMEPVEYDLKTVSGRRALEKRLDSMLQGRLHNSSRGETFDRVKGSIIVGMMSEAEKGRRVVKGEVEPDLNALKPAFKSLNIAPELLKENGIVTPDESTGEGESKTFNMFPKSRRVGVGQLFGGYALSTADGLGYIVQPRRLGMKATVEAQDNLRSVEIDIDVDAQIDMPMDPRRPQYLQRMSVKEKSRMECLLVERKKKK